MSYWGGRRSTGAGSRGAPVRCRLQKKVFLHARWVGLAVWCMRLRLGMEEAKGVLVAAYKPPDVKTLWNTGVFGGHGSEVDEE